MCERNIENSKLVYNLSPNFQLHTLYIPDCIYTLRKILKSSSEMLHSLGHYQINYNAFNLAEKEKQIPSSILNIVINIVDSSNQNKSEPSLNFSRQNKLVNLLFNI